MLVRRALLALAAFTSWCVLAWMARLSSGVPAQELGRGGWLAAPLRAATPLLGLLMAAAAVLLVRRRTRYFGAAACFVILWIFDFVIRRPGGEHSHFFALTACLVYAATGFLRGPRDSAERTAWEACCAFVGAAYFLCGIAKLRYTGIGWAQARSIQLFLMISTAQAHGWQLRAREFMVASPRLILLGSSFILLLELLGPLLMIRRFRPYYLAGLVVMIAGIFFGMDIVLGVFYFLVAAAAAFPFEAALIRGERALLGAPSAAARGRP